MSVNWHYTVQNKDGSTTTVVRFRFDFRYRSVHVANPARQFGHVMEISDHYYYSFT